MGGIRVAINDYASLQTSILGHLGRPGDTNIPTADMITLCEAELNRVLRTQKQIKALNITTVGGTQNYALPTDFLAILEVKVTSTVPVRVLESMGPGTFDCYLPPSHSGTPCAYSIVGSEILFGPLPDGVYTIKFLYYSKIPALTNSNTTNFLLTDHPDIYLFCALRHSQTFLGGDETDTRLAIFEQRANAAIAALRQLDIRGKTGGTPIRMRTYLHARDNVFPR